MLFTDETCPLQDPLLKNEIALGVLKKIINDLYVFDYDHIKHSLTYSYQVFLVSSSVLHYLMYLFQIVIVCYDIRDLVKFL